MSQKKSFVLYADQYLPIQKLSLEQKGQLLEAMFQFHAGVPCVFEDPVVGMAFAFFRQTFERDAEKYERKCRQNKENVTKRHSKAPSQGALPSDFCREPADFCTSELQASACGASGCVASGCGASGCGASGGVPSGGGASGGVASGCGASGQSADDKGTSGVSPALHSYSEGDVGVRCADSYSKSDGGVQSCTLVPKVGHPCTAGTDSESDTESDTESGSEKKIPLKDPDGSFVGGPPDCPQEHVCALYHELLPELPRAMTWGKNRRALLRTRWRETWERLKKHGKEHDEPALLLWWKTYFLRVKASPFLMGRVLDRNNKPFFADLEWLVRPANYAKVIDGKYLERRPVA